MLKDRIEGIIDELQLHGLKRIEERRAREEGLLPRLIAEFTFTTLT